MNDDVKTIAADPDDDRLRTLFDDSVIALTSIRHTLADMVRAVRDGEGGSLRDITAKLKELETALLRAIETEQRYHEWKAKRDGDQSATASNSNDNFDLDAARYQIGCRLARLRECCREE